MCKFVATHPQPLFPEGSLKVAADAGIIAMSLAISPGMAESGSYWVIPTESYSRLEQGYAVLQRSKGKSSVKTFLEFVQGKKVEKILSDFGFILP